MPKLMLFLAAVLATACCLGPATAAAKPASTKLSITDFPEGVYGYVTSPRARTCSSARKVAVYQKLGHKRDPKTDRRIGRTAAAKSGARWMWTVKTGRSGPLYAVAAATERCAAALSGSVKSAIPPLRTAATGTQYPSCGPYVSEGTSEICYLGQLYLGLTSTGDFGRPSGSVPGYGHDAPYPWGPGTADSYTVARIFWQPEDSGERSVTIATYLGTKPEGDAKAYLGGHIANSSSDRFTVTDAYARNEFGYPNGDHFYTPGLPGQEPGEVGGPLRFDFKNGSGGNWGQVWVSGYLYLKP